jgi:hypothetical protein
LLDHAYALFDSLAAVSDELDVSDEPLDESPDLPRAWQQRGCPSRSSRIP